MKTTFFKVSYLTLCLLIATPHALHAEQSGWKFWLGVGAACLGGAAIAASFIEDDPESLIEDAQKTYHSEKYKYKQIIKHFNQTYNSEKLQYISSINLKFNEISNSLSRLCKAENQLEKAHSLLSKKINKVKHRSDYYQVEALQRRIKECDRFRNTINHYIFHKLWPVAFGCTSVELEKNYHSLYKESTFEGSVETYIQRHHGRSMYPYCEYNNELGKSLHRAQTIISDWEKFRVNIHDTRLSQTNYEWFCCLNNRIDYYADHAQQLRSSLHNLQAYVKNSAQYNNEQHRQEMERMRLENERILRQQQREINRLKNQVQTLEWERYTAPEPCPVYVDVNIQI